MSLAHTAFKFQQQCNRSQEILQRCLLQNKKSETNVNNNEELRAIEIKPDKLEEDEECKKFQTHKEKLNFKYYMRANGEKVYICNLCNKIYKYSSSLKIHMRTHTQEKPYVCNICGKNFKQYSSLTYHHRSHTGEQPYSCKICGKKYKQSGSLTAHMRIHTGQRPFLCSVCGRGFR